MEEETNDDAEKKRIDALQASITYSPPYTDDNKVYEYRWVQVPRTVLRQYDMKHERSHLLQEAEWRALGLCMSRGWEHIDFYGTDRLTWVFRRRLDEKKKKQAEMVEKD